MRKFTLINANGDEYNLTERKSFFHTVGGLGYERSNSYKYIGDSFTLLESRFKQPVISGSVYLGGDQTEYERFILFSQIAPLKLKYEPIPGSVYFCNGHITSVKFEEKDSRQVSISFTQTTPFYKVVAVATYPEDAESDGKIYSYSYPYIYNSTVVNSVILNLDSAIESPCKLSMYGPLENPEWKHYVNNALYATGKVLATIARGNRLVVDTTGGEFTMRVYNPGNEVIADLYQASDFSTARAIYLQRGRNQISISDDRANKTIVTAEGEFRYASV